ncbi:leucine-rich repeat domain-containing protein, partial [Bacteroides salyersiae]
MKKIFLYICMICLAGLSTYAAINGTQANDDTFATNALKEGSFPLTFEQESTTAPWTTAGNGVVTSSNKEANSEVGFSTTFNLSFDATVSFDWSVNGDQLIFYVDNKQVTNISGIISNYTPYSYDLKTGVHTLKWSYKNSSSATTGDDRGYVKNIYMSPTSFIMPGVAYPVCETQLYFGNVVKNAPTTVNLNVRNIGSEQLNITKVTTDNTIFSIGDYEKNIPALETRTIPFTVTVTAEGLIEAKAIIVTNGGTREVSLRANCTSDITSIAVTSPGNLSNQVSASDYAKINNLKLTGVINDTDIAFIKQNLTAVKTLDLLDASFINNSINTQFQKNTWVTLILPKGTLTINSAALQESEWLQSIVLPEGLTDINSNAFYKCSSLQNIVLPSTLRTIGIRAFNDCASLKAITIPDRVESIEQYVFYECSALEEIIIGNGVKSISGYGPFEGCSNLKKVVIGNGLTDLTGSIFQGKTNLTEVILGENITTIGSSCFMGCTGLEKITLPKKLRNINGAAFLGCSNLRTIEMPDSLRTLKDQVFEGCENLQSIILADSLTGEIGNRAFYNCKSLTTITIPDKAESIGQYVFSGCSALEEIIIGNEVKSISGYGP